MSATTTDIANRALQKLGQPHIDNITEDSENARTMARAYPSLRDRLLREFDWNFAIARASVPKEADETVFGGLNRYKLPSDFSRLLREKETDGTPESRKDWQIEGDEIVTADGSPLQFRYIRKVTNSGLFDDLFVEYLVATMAYETCEEVTGSNTKKDHLKDDMDRLKRDAKQINSYENDADEPAEDDWLIARR